MMPMRHTTRFFLYVHRNSSAESFAHRFDQLSTSPRREFCGQTERFPFFSAPPEIEEPVNVPSVLGFLLDSD